MPGPRLSPTSDPQALPVADLRRAKTSDRIVDVAERLFGQYGIEGVSMRQVMLEAGASNKSAIAYHFGNKDNLIRAIWQRRLPSMQVSRAAMLASAQACGTADDPETLMRVLFLPTYEPVDAEGYHRYAAFLLQALRSSSGHRIRDELMSITPSSFEAVNRMRQACARLDEATFHWRLFAATSLFLDLVADRDRDKAGGQPILEETRFLAEAIHVCTACMMAPPITTANF